MVYLLLTAAVLCVTVQNLIAKQYNASVKNPNTYMFSSLVAASAMVFFLIINGGKFKFVPETAGYSLSFAAMYSMAMIGNVMAINCGPLAISTLINQCSLIIPTLYGIFALKENLSAVGYLGIILVFVCLFLVKPQTKEGDAKVSPKWFAWVATGFVGNGMCSTIQKMQQLKFGGAYKSEFMTVALAVGALVMFASACLSSKSITADIASAIKYAPFEGAANGGLNMLVMLLTSLVPTAILFPVVMSGGVVITFIASVTLFKEKLAAKQLVGYVLGALSIVLINL